MARTRKIDNALLKRYSAKKTKRKTDTRDKHKFYLIVCEGTKTEPNYFESLKKNLPKGVVELFNIDIEGTGKNTLTIIEDAKKYRKAYEQKYHRTIDKTWAVFDRDSFPAQNFDNAISKAEKSKPKIHCAWSNEAFEIWYLLHFHFFNTGLTRDRYAELIEKELKKHYSDYKYEKNSIQMYDLLQKHENMDFAIENAKKLEALYYDKKYSTHNPRTKVYAIVEELIKQKEEK